MYTRPCSSAAPLLAFEFVMYPVTLFTYFYSLLLGIVVCCTYEQMQHNS